MSLADKYANLPAPETPEHKLCSVAKAQANMSDDDLAFLERLLAAKKTVTATDIALAMRLDGHTEVRAEAVRRHRRDACLCKVRAIA